MRNHTCVPCYSLWNKNIVTYSFVGLMYLFAAVLKIISRIVLLLLFFTGSISKGQDVSESSTLAGKILGTADEVRALNEMEASRNLSVQLTGVITYCDDAWSSSFLQDNTAGIFLNTGCEEFGVHTGDLVEVVGVTGEGEFAPVVIPSNILVLGKSPMPALALTTQERIFSGLEDSQYIELTGVVQKVGRLPHLNEEDVVNRKVTGGHPFLHVVNDQRTWNAVFPVHSTFELPEYLLDHRIKIKGVAATLFNARRQLMGIRLFVHDISSVEIIDEGPADPFSIPLSSIESLNHFDPDRPAGKRVHISGSVILQYAPTSFYLRDESGAMFVEMDSAVVVAPGDLLHVAGFINTSSQADHPIKIQSATVQYAGRGPAPEPLKMDPADIIAGAHDAEYVQLFGTLVKLEQRLAEKALMLDTGNTLVRANVSDTLNSFADLQIGSTLQLTGITVLEILETTQGALSYGFWLRLEDRQSIITLAQPPWLTRDRMLILSSILVGFVVLGLVWVKLLGKQVDKQTAIIKKKMEEEVELRKAARAAHKAKNEFLSVISHEVRTPMNGIFGMSSYLETTALNEDQEESIHIIKSSCKRLLHAIESLLNYSNLESGYVDVLRETFSVNELINDRFGDISSEAGRKKIELRSTIDASVPQKVYGDMVSLAQIIEILLSNAVKFSSEGIVHLSATAVPAEVGQLRLCISVRDTGIGIPEDKLKNIFEPFSQVDSSHGRVFEGLGLGLAICKRLCEHMGGYITVESRLAEGSVFSAFVYVHEITARLNPDVMVGRVDI